MPMILTIKFSGEGTVTGPRDQHQHKLVELELPAPTSVYGVVEGFQQFLLQCGWRKDQIDAAFTACTKEE